MAANGGDEIQMKGREPVIEETEDDGCSAVVGYIIQSVYHFFFFFFLFFLLQSHINASHHLHLALFSHGLCQDGSGWML